MASKPEPRISLVTLGVQDLSASTAFYRDRLGWSPGFANDDVTFFQMGGMVLGLWRKAAMAEHLGLDAASLGPGGMELAHNVRAKEEVATTLDAVAAAGATILVPAHDAPWGGVTGNFQDPDGYRWEVAWNPSWTITDDGDTVMDDQSSR